jgi:hypothetical protein
MVAVLQFPAGSPTTSRLMKSHPDLAFDFAESGRRKWPHLRRAIGDLREVERSACEKDLGASMVRLLF